MPQDPKPRPVAVLGPLERPLAPCLAGDVGRRVLTRRHHVLCVDTKARGAETSRRLCKLSVLYDDRSSGTLLD